MVVLPLVVKIFVFLRLVVYTFELVLSVIVRFCTAPIVPIALYITSSFTEEESGRVHIRSHRVLTRGFLHQLLCKFLVALNRLVPHPVLPPSVRDPNHVYARSPATSTYAAAASTHAAFVAPTCAIFSPPPSAHEVARASDRYRRCLWVSRCQTELVIWPVICLWVFTGRYASGPPPLGTAPATSAGAFFGFPHQQLLPLMPRQQPLLLEPQPSHGWSHLLVALPVPQDEPRNGPFITR